jgi:hypothetical protein
MALFRTTLQQSPLRGRNLDAHPAMNSRFAVLRCQVLTRKTWLKPLRILKQMQLRRVLLPYRSPSAKDTRLRKLKKLPFSSISGNGRFVTLNGIVTRGKEGFLANSRRFIAPQKKTRRDVLATVLSKKWRRRCGYSFKRRHLINRTIFCERHSRPFVMTCGTRQIRIAPNVKNMHPVVIGVRQPIGSNDRYRISSTVVRVQPRCSSTL